MLKVLQIRDQVVVQVEDFEAPQLRKALLIGKFLDLVEAQVNLLERLKQSHMLLHVKQLQTIVLKVNDHQVDALR
jgi:hypothetical protein